METPMSFVVDGQTLFGMLHVPDGPRPTRGFSSVVILHGFTGNRGGDHRLLVLLSRHLSALGVASLRFDFRGSGESEGDFSEMTVSREVEDVKGAFAIVRQRPDFDAERVMLLGFSMGGLVAALAASSVRAHRLALWAPALPSLWAPWIPALPSLPDVSDMRGWPLGRAFLEELPSLDPLGAVSRFEGPVRVFHGEADATVPLELGRAYASAANADLVVLPGANHTFDSLPSVRSLYEATGVFLGGSL